MTKLGKGFRGLALSIACLVPSLAAAAACGNSVTFGGTFGLSYTCNDLGQPSAIPGPLGGITFLDSDTLLIGGSANNSGGVIRQIDVVRDVNGHITGFAPLSTGFATAPFIDGGLSFGPGGVLFATGYPNNTLLQYKPGSTTPDKIVDLNALSIGSSVGGLAFVPAGFAGAGQMKIVSFNTGQWYTAALTDDGSGTYDVSAVLETTLAGGPEGMVYIDAANIGFGIDSVLVAEWSAGKVAAYEIDSNGNPVNSTRREFLSGLSGAEGALIDPVTGDFLFSTFGGGDRVLVISGFLVPDPNPNPAPEPGSLVLLGAGLVILRSMKRRRL